MAENSALIPEDVTMFTQTEILKEPKDLTKNLVSGDFERQYKVGMMEKNVKRRRNCVIAGISLGALVVWLLVLTIVRELQIARLRQDVEQLSANMIVMSANIMSLNQKLANNSLFNELITLEDTILADDVEDDSERNKQKTESLEKLRGLTVLEDDKQLDDDEDTYQGDNDEESGDWYPDYDRRREKIGTTNMEKLNLEDYADTVLRSWEKSDIKSMSADDYDDGPQVVKVNQNYENEHSEKPNVTQPSPMEPGSMRDKRSVLPDPKDSGDLHSSPKAISKDERRKTKKFSPNSVTEKAALSRTARNSNDADGRRPFIAAHFHGNTSHLSPEIHEHYKGNGLVRVSHDAPHDVWYPAPWTVASPHPRPTLTRTGHVHVHHTGIYFVYVQIYYVDSHDVISWVLHRTNAEQEGRDTLLQCTHWSHSPEPVDKPNSCFSAAALFLRAGDRLAVRNTSGDRHSLMQPEKSFIGLVKLADGDQPEEEF